jgi:hypothetical protein
MEKPETRKVLNEIHASVNRMWAIFIKVVDVKQEEEIAWFSEEKERVGNLLVELNIKGEAASTHQTISAGH